MDLINWLLSGGSDHQPAVVDGTGILSRRQLRDLVVLRTREMLQSITAADSAIALTGSVTRDWLLNYLGALGTGWPVHLRANRGDQSVAGWSMRGCGSKSLYPGLAVCMNTSGSTGRPAEVPLTAPNLIANGNAIITTLGITPEDRILCSLPLTSSFGLSLLHTALGSGGTVCLPEGELNVPTTVEYGRRYGVSIVGFVPILARRAALRKEGMDRLPYLRMIQVAGGRLDCSTTHILAERLNDKVSLQVMYGLTEATARVTAYDVRRHADKVGSCGRPIEGVRIRIEGPTGDLLGPGRDGVVVVSSPGVSPAFARDDGWLATPDRGHVDVDGFLWITSRSGDFAKIGGKRMTLLEVEDFLLSFPGVELAAAVAIPDAVYGERVSALVVPERGRLLSAVEILAVARKKLPKVLVPVRLKLVGDLPLTQNGKIDRGRLPELLEGQEG